MKLYEIVSQPEQDIEEAPVGMLKRAAYGIGRRLGSGSAAAKGDVAAEANRLKAALKKWMAGSGLKGKLTIDQLEQFLAQVGYSGVAKKVVQDMRGTKSAAQKAGAAVAKGAKAAGQAVAKGAKAVAQGRSATANNPGAAPQQALNQSMTNEYHDRLAELDLTTEKPLTNKEIDAAILKAVQYGYQGTGAKADKGQWAYEPEKQAAPAEPAAQAADTAKGFDPKSIPKGTTINVGGEEYTWHGGQFTTAKNKMLSKKMNQKIKSDPEVLKALITLNKAGVGA